MRDEELSEPFFEDSILRIQRTKSATPSDVTTQLRPLYAFTADELGRPPNGFIFHVSRCGSTAVANALRSSGRFRVISEAQPLNTLLLSPIVREHPNAALLLRNAAMLLGNRISREPKPYVVKFTSWNLFQIEHIHSIWPSVPWIFLYRQPVEVAASILESPVGWMTGHKSPERCRDFGIDIVNPASLSREEYVAKVLALFARKATSALGIGATVVSYDSISTPVVAEISRNFGEELSVLELRNIQRSLGLQSKDREQRNPFIQHRRQPSIAMSAAVDQWARSYFECLRETLESSCGHMRF
jgi:hypothetical protein